MLFGEASHGTSEFYRWRAELTAQLIAEYDFEFVAVEADWTSCYEGNRYLKGLPGSADSAREVLESFDRWPTWMWANWEVDGFLDWLAAENRDPEGPGVGENEVGVYGLDGDEWGAEMAELQVPAAKAGSYEDVFHRAGTEHRLLHTDDVPDKGGLAESRGHRAVGVVYRPALESGNYVPTDLAERYDVYLHIDETQTLHPLERHPERYAIPGLYPTGL